MYAKKLTHSHFSKGGYLLVHYFQNQIENNNHYNNEISNDIPEQDHSLKNKYSLKFKRNADPVLIEHCCSNTGNECGKLLCH